jgi:hypothetical protein
MTRRGHRPKVRPSKTSRPVSFLPGYWSIGLHEPSMQVSGKRRGCTIETGESLILVYCVPQNEAVVPVGRDRSAVPLAQTSEFT